MTDPTTTALIRAALAMADVRGDVVGAYAAFLSAIAAYRAAHPEAGMDGE